MEKSVGERVRKYGLQSQRGLAYFRSREMLRESGLAISESKVNCLLAHNGSENMKHFLVKAAVFKLLRGMGRTVGTEVEVNGGIVDVLDIGNMIAYEVENGLTKEKLKAKMASLSGMRDVFFIDILDVPDDMSEAEAYVKDRLV